MSLESFHSNGDNLNWKGKYIVAGKSGNVYFPIKCIGDGSFATVWMTYLFNKKMNVKKMVALKIFLNCNKDVAEKEYALYETFKCMKIRNIIEIYDMFPATNQDESCICIAMEIAYGSLFSIADNVCLKNGFPVPFIVKIAHQLLETLSDMHKNNLIHCDIKPENILIRGNTQSADLLLQFLVKHNNRQAILKEIMNAYPNDSTSMMSDNIIDDVTDAYVANCIDETDTDSSSDENSICDTSDINNIIQDPHVVLADLGSCVTIGSKEHSDVLSLVQTRYYKSPEVILCAPYDTSTDIWSLGCTLYELSMGKMMFNTKGMKNIDKMRGLLHLITDTFGELPSNVIDEGLHSMVFYTCSHHQKGTLLKNSNNNIWIEFLACTKNALLLDLILSLCKLDKKKRISAHEALQHNLFAKHMSTKNI